MTEQIPTPEDFFGNPEPAIWAEIERYAKNNDEYSAALLSLRARVEALEGRYETQRLATLEWGKDVDKLQIRSDRHLQRIEALEANLKPTPNLGQIRSSDITPPPELVEKWANDSVPRRADAIGRDWEIAFATRAAAWGVDQELEACVEYLTRCAQWEPEDVEELRAARRPKPPSLKRQALSLIDECTDPEGDYLDDNALSIIRRALEQLPDD